VPTITLLTDFGLKDSYVAQMKAVILSICPKATVVDISHQVERHNLRMGAFILASAAPYFPNGTIHVAVVDPGVGGKRRPIMIETNRSFYVGPDNGLLLLAAKSDGIREVYHIVEKRFMAEQISTTFHGRDIFAPVAAHLANGVEPSRIGIAITDYVLPDYSQAKIEGRAVDCEVVHIDRFGNVVTNLHSKDLGKTVMRYGASFKLKHEGKLVGLKLCRTYSDVEVGTLLALIGSHGFLEIAVNQGSAAKRLEVAQGSKLKLS
jgi:S-adenosylmethionine hydrolase